MSETIDAEVNITNFKIVAQDFDDMLVGGLKKLAHNNLFLNLVKLNQICIVITLFRFI